MSLFNISEHFNQLSADMQKYIESSIEFYKLDTFKKMMSASVSLVNLLVSGAILMIFLLFISVGAAIIIGEALGSLSYGYFIVAAVYLIVFILFKLFAKPLITKIVLRKYSKEFFNESTQSEVLREDLEKLNS